MLRECFLWFLFLLLASCSPGSDNCPLCPRFPDAGSPDIGKATDARPDNGPEPDIMAVQGIYGMSVYSNDPEVPFEGVPDDLFGWVLPLSQHNLNKRAILINPRQGFLYPAVLDGWGKICAKFKFQNVLHYVKDNKEAYGLVEKSMVIDGGFVDQYSFYADASLDVSFPDGANVFRKDLWLGMRMELADDKLNFRHFTDPFGLYTDDQPEGWQRLDKCDLSTAMKRPDVGGMYSVFYGETKDDVPAKDTQRYYTPVLQLDNSPDILMISGVLVDLSANGELRADYDSDMPMFDMGGSSEEFFMLKISYVCSGKFDLAKSGFWMKCSETWLIGEESAFEGSWIIIGEKYKQ